ncbi:MAG: hypothetical protein R3B49_02475 [Phycisphaerales bacterium]
MTSCRGYLHHAMAGDFGHVPFQAQLIPLLLMVGVRPASRPSSRCTVWLPDAMEGPTPVSARRSTRRRW